MGQLDSIVKTVVELEESPQKRARFFTLYLKEGIMINPDDKKRNVAFRTDTIQRMFNAVYTDLFAQTKTQGVDPDKVQKKVDKAFFCAGLTCGKSFGIELVNEVWKGGRDFSLQERLDKWCAFDSNVGFGRFSKKVVKVDDSGSIISGKIVLTNNFLAIDGKFAEASRKPIEADLCKFMIGYIQGVLTEITNTNIEVTHEPKDCTQHKKSRGKCGFYFRRVE